MSIDNTSGEGCATIETAKLKRCRLAELSVEPILNSLSFAIRMIDERRLAALGLNRVPSSDEKSREHYMAYIDECNVRIKEALLIP